MAAITPDTARPDTLTLYSSVPEYIQDWDAQNGYSLLSWVDGAFAMLQPIDELVRDGYDNNGIGYSLLFNYLYYYSGTLQGVSSQGLADVADVNQALTVLPWFAQFVGTELPQIPTSALFSQDIVNAIQPYVNNWIELIVSANSFERGTPSSVLNSLASFLTNLNNFQKNTIQVTSGQFTQATQIATYSFIGQRPTVGNYYSIYGFKKTDAIFNLNKVQIVNVTINSDGASGTFDVLPNALIETDQTSNSSNFGTAMQTISPSAFTLLEQTKYINSSFVYDPYSIAILVPKLYFPLSQYKKINGIGVFDYSQQYTVYEPGGAAGYSTYSSYPNTLSNSKFFINQYIPAGLSCQIVLI